MSSVSPVALAKSGRVLYAFSHFYFPFYGRQPKALFWEFDPFAWISAFVYEIDEDIELQRDLQPSLGRLDALRDYMADRLHMDATIHQLFDDARRYYNFETRVCRSDADYTLDCLISILDARSFDFRLMHRALSQRCVPAYREELFTWFRSFEMLMEIEDDAASVSVDADQETFNVFVLAERVAGAEGVRAVESVRDDVERNVREQVGDLQTQDRGLCGHVLQLYRDVVRRPQVTLHQRELMEAKYG